MKIVDQSHQILHITPDPYQLIELAGRTCYKSEDKITGDSARVFVAGLVKRGHLAMIEFADLTVRFVTDRGVSHELVRHRLCSFAQESTRYVSYGDDKKQPMLFIRPSWLPRSLDPQSTADAAAAAWITSCRQVEENYTAAMNAGAKAQEARQVLNNSVKTEVVMKGNFREWRHIFQLRAVEKAAHPQMRALMIPLYETVRGQYPEVFDLGNPET